MNKKRRKTIVDQAWEWGGGEEGEATEAALDSTLSKKYLCNQPDSLTSLPGFCI